MSLLNRLLRIASPVVLFVLSVYAIITQPSCTHLPPTSETLDARRLRSHVDTLAVEYAPRNYREPENLEACSSYIFEHFNQAGGRVTVQPFKVEQVGSSATRIGDIVYRNVIASFGPQDGKRIVVGAHYDACGETPGADDNASGVAGLIELAYLLGRTELNQRVDLVAFTLEEPPFFTSSDMGSARHAESLRREGVEVEVMICLEMIGFFSEERGSQRFPTPLLKLFYPSRADYIAVVGGFHDRKLVREVKASMRGATELPVHSMCAFRRFAGIDLSDHRNYWNAGYEALMITDTSFYRNQRYHGMSDTPETLDYECMANVVLGVYEAVVRLANGDH